MGVSAKRCSSVFCIYNFSNYSVGVDKHIFEWDGLLPAAVYDHWSQKTIRLEDLPYEQVLLAPYQFLIAAPL